MFGAKEAKAIAKLRTLDKNNPVAALDTIAEACEAFGFRIALRGLSPERRQAAFQHVARTAADPESQVLQIAFQTAEGAICQALFVMPPTTPVTEGDAAPKKVLALNAAIAL